MGAYLQRIYDRSSTGAHARVLVDRLWPRGVSKQDAALDAWLREVAPSDELRRWYDHDPDRFETFRERYRAELSDGEQAQALEELRKRASADDVVLLTATRDLARSHAQVLAELL